MLPSPCVTLNGRESIGGLDKLGTRGVGVSHILLSQKNIALKNSTSRC